MTFIDSIRRQLQAMSATERQRAISSLRDLIYEDAYTHALHPATDDGVACPRCCSWTSCWPRRTVMRRGGKLWYPVSGHYWMLGPA